MDTDDLKFPFDEKKLGKEKTLCVAESKGSKAGFDFDEKKLGKEKTLCVAESKGSKAGCHFVPTGRAQFSLGGKWSTGGGKKKKSV